MSASDNYERLQLSKKDLQYLFNQMRHDITSRLDYHVPGQGPHDPLKMEVESQLNSLLVETFELAKHAMVVDGYDLQNDDMSIKELLSLENMEEVAPFDLEINAQLRKIIGEVEAETTATAELRRNTPRKARKEYKRLIETTDSRVTSAIDILENDVDTMSQNISEEHEDGLDLNALIPRFDQIVEDYQSGLISLNDSKKNIPERRAELVTLDETIKFLEASYMAQQSELETGM